MHTRRRWKPDEIDFLFDNMKRIPISEIASHLGRSEMSVNLFLLRRRTSPRTVVKNNLILLILKEAFVDPGYFMPNRAFFYAVRIGQKRWWSLYKGVEVATGDECLRVANHLKVPTIRIFNQMQLSLFDELPENRTNND